MPDRVNVFISSTMYDLEAYRRAASDAIIEAGMFPIWLEAISTMGNMLDVFTDLLDRSEIVIGIYAHWYGNFPPDHSVSWIEFEANYAAKHGKLYIPMMVADDYPWKHELYENRQPHTDLLQAFKQRIWKDHRVLRFTDVPSLKGQLVQALQRKPFSELSSNRVVSTPLWGAPDDDSQFHADIFMVMPFRPQQNLIYETCIKPLVADLNMTMKRGDDFLNDDYIMSNVWAAINHAKVIIADCTGQNPNVFYELGIAHTLGKPTLVLTQNRDDIPFDLRHLRYLLYDPENLDKLTADLSAGLKRLTS